MRQLILPNQLLCYQGRGLHRLEEMGSNFNLLVFIEKYMEVVNCHFVSGSSHFLGPYCCTKPAALSLCC